MQANDKTAIDPPEALPDAPRVPGYRIVRRLGLGGMAMVYLAVQESLDREVAIKVMRPVRQLDEAQALRFEHEARIIAKLEHPGIVGIHEVGRTPAGELYYVMPYLARGDLGMRHFLDDEPGLIALLRALLDALGYAHARGIVHRDVKAENVLFDNAGRPQLADFGIALVHRDGQTRMTGDGLAIGSSAQMSPEQARAGAIDGRSDLYSLGVLTFELLTGELPFHSSDPLALALMHAQDPVPRLPEDKAHWQAFVDRAMAKRPEQRFRNAQAMHRALEPIERQIQRSATRLGRLRGVLRPTPPLLVALAALITISLLSLAMPWLRGSRGSSEEPARPATHSIEAAPAFAQAREQFSAGKWLEPAGDNAAASWLEILRSDPGNAEASAGLESIIEGLGSALVLTEPAETLGRLRERYLQIELLADQAGQRDGRAFAILRSTLSPAVLQRTKTAIASHDRGEALALLAFATELGGAESGLTDLREQANQLPTTGTRMQDPAGPVLLFIPMQHAGSTLSKPVFMMRDEVSRGDYAAFAVQGNRPAARCRNRLSPLRLLDRRDWKDPGFTQAVNEPVVCVNFDDARAYATWLSQRSGHRYRLPTRAEWQHAAASSAARGNPCKLGNIADRNAKGAGAKHSCDDGHAATSPSGRYAANALGLNDMSGNVGEWTLDCAPARECTRRNVIGMSWRDGPDAHGDARPLEADRGYDDIGFRLVREL